MTILVRGQGSTALVELLRARKTRGVHLLVRKADLMLPRCDCGIHLAGKSMAATLHFRTSGDLVAQEYHEHDATDEKGADAPRHSHRGHIHATDLCIILRREA